jgi:hypothetical protein
MRRGDPNGNSGPYPTASLIMHFRAGVHSFRQDRHLIARNRWLTEEAYVPTVAEKTISGGEIAN